MKKLSFFGILFLFSLMIFAQTIDSKNGNKEIELIVDANFSNGIGLIGVSSSNPSVVDTLYPFGKGQSAFSWKLAQWYSRFNLKGVLPARSNDSVAYANEGKRITFLPVNGSTQVNMEVFGSKEYLSPRKLGEGWPHLLLEQDFRNPVRVNWADSLVVTMDAKLMYSENKMDSAAYDSSLHTAQFSMYLVVQNLNNSSSDYGDYLWFGLHLYDYRYREIPKYEEKDKGKKDATGKFIYCPASSELYAGNFQDGHWINISKDLLPAIKQAFQAAQARGYLKGSTINDMYIASMNIGWEVPGTFDCGFQYKNLELIAIKK